MSSFIPKDTEHFRDTYTFDTACCGIIEYANLVAHPIETIFANFAELFKYKFAAIVNFSDNEHGEKLQEVEEFIDTNKLGTITYTPEALNKNSGNLIKQLSWNVNHDNLEKWRINNDNIALDSDYE